MTLECHKDEKIITKFLFLVELTIALFYKQFLSDFAIMADCEVSMRMQNKKKGKH